MTLGFPTRSDTNQALPPQKMASGLKFWILEVNYVAKTKALISCALISCAVTAQLICTFVFTFVKNSFSHDAAINSSFLAS